ncbi:hypothetical protein DENIS_1801 [Desulfonema ishimotonii]|uniref:Haem-binding uptake Tiki superfamily ChaN domain-containing protein n=1 Tax=Desulfonema ishimotonii TaxID=45657 RepID=A0A401FV40_9BACT|nr:ChaN family lipoprotein [Desulfonema ishimotonii]GBC60842.1 hypothetical protein DENIS_1801 [Desulfonema ishimotonii]
MKFHQKSPEVTVTDYRIYDAQGQPSDLAQMISAAAEADVVFIGEEHDDPVAHFLEKEILRELRTACGGDGNGGLSRPLVLSMEMFERDIQMVVDEYFGDLITERHFRSAVRPWWNYQTDYRPVVEFAREKKIPLVAANAPGRYVNRVSRLGPEALGDLSPTAAAWLPPAPWAEASDACRRKFRKFWDESAKQAEASRKKRPPESPPPPHGSGMEAFDFEHILSAQTLRDAAMADAIAHALERHPGGQILHICGKFHSAGGLGVPEHLARYRPGVRMLAVTISAEAHFPEFVPDEQNAGDFMIITNPALKRPPRTFGMGF